MNKAMRKLFALVLSLALVLTGLGWLGSSNVYAAVGDTELTVKLVDAESGDPVSGITMNLISNDPTGVDKTFDEPSDDTGLTSYEIANDDLWVEEGAEDCYYWIEAPEDCEYTCDPVKVEFREANFDLYVATVGGQDYSADNPPQIALTKKQAPVEYTITFDAQNGSDPTTATTTGGKLAALPEDPEKQGVAFVAWYDAAEGGNEVTTDTTFTADTTVYAQWVDPTAPYDANDYTYGEYSLSTATNQETNALYPGNDHSYMLPGTKWVVTGFSRRGAAKFKANNTDLVIPAKDTDGKTVQGVGNNAFNASTSSTNPVIKESGKKVTSVVFPTGIMTKENIDEINTKWALYLGKHGPLTEVGDFYIGYRAFSNNDISELVIPEGTILVDMNAFTANKLLTKVTFPSTLAVIASQAFGQCNQLREVMFPTETDIRLSIRTMSFFQNVLNTSQEVIPLPKDTLQVQGGSTSAFRPNSPSDGKVKFTIRGKESTLAQTDTYHEITYLEASAQVEAKEATCTEDGNAAGYKCLACGKIFSDEALTQEIENGIIPATGHTEGTAEEVKTEPTYDAAGKVESVVKCTVCGDVLNRETKETIPSLKDQADTAIAAAAVAEAATEGKTGEDLANAAAAWAEAAQDAVKAAKSAYDAAVAEYGEDSDQANAADKVLSDAQGDLSKAQQAAAEAFEEAAKTSDLRDEAVVLMAELAELVDKNLYTKSSCDAFDKAYAEFKEMVDSTATTSRDVREKRAAVTKAFNDLVLRTSIAPAKITGLTAKNYTGKAITQNPVVTLDGKQLEAKDYKVSYKNNVNGGTATVIITGGGDDYTGTATATFKINPIEQKMTVKAATKTVKAKKARKKAQKVSALTVKNAQGAVAYKKAGGSKKLTVNAKTGKITVKKKTKKGTYKVKVTVAAKGNANYKAASQTVQVTVKVK